MQFEKQILQKIEKQCAKSFWCKNNLVLIENTNVCYVKLLFRLEKCSWAWFNTMNKKTISLFVLCVTFYSTLYLCKQFIMWMFEIFKFPRWFYHFLKNICSHFCSVGFYFFTCCLWKNHDQGTKYYLCANEVTGIFWGQHFSANPIINGFIHKYEI